MAFLSFRVGDGGVFLFAGFGLLFGIPLVIAVIKVFSRRSAFLKKMDEKISGEPKPVTFVPHRFVVLAVLISIICILAVIFLPILFR